MPTAHQRIRPFGKSRGPPREVFYLVLHKQVIMMSFFTHDGQESSRIFSSTARTGPYGMVSLKTPGRPASGRSRRFLMKHHSPFTRSARPQSCSRMGFSRFASGTGATSTTTSSRASGPSNVESNSSRRHLW